MANKLFRIERTEDEDTSTAGPATITRADDPQLLPIVPLDKDKGQPDVADPVDNRIYATKEDEQEILFVTDKVTEGDFNPVTSNAVKKAIDDIKDVYSTNEIKTNKVWIDGKPIYRKVLDCGTVASAKNILHNIQNISYVTDILCIAKDPNGNFFVNGSAYGRETYNLCRAVVTPTQVILNSIVSTSTPAMYNVMVVVEYTKA